ncbi:MAG TPA: DUF4870 domain-containing protein [Pyrinomonadaceae bacterium]|nr:DUF4870 domain-containing protein [Pyrinomonadaceae bacterium]
MNNMQYRPPMQLQTPEEKQMGMFIHLSSLVYAFFYPIGAALPIILWQTQKDQMPALDQHGKNATNWIISSFIYMAVSIPLMFVLIGFLIAPVVWVLMVVFPIIAGIKANNGETWEYPLTIKFIK